MAQYSSGPAAAARGAPSRTWQAALAAAGTAAAASRVRGEHWPSTRETGRRAGLNLDRLLQGGIVFVFVFVVGLVVVVRRRRRRHRIVRAGTARAGSEVPRAAAGRQGIRHCGRAGGRAGGQAGRRAGGGGQSPCRRGGPVSVLQVCYLYMVCYSMCYSVVSALQVYLYMCRHVPPARSYNIIEFHWRASWLKTRSRHAARSRWPADTRAAPRAERDARIVPRRGRALHDVCTDADKNKYTGCTKILYFRHAHMRGPRPAFARAATPRALGTNPPRMSAHHGCLHQDGAGGTRRVTRARRPLSESLCTKRAKRMLSLAR